MPIELPSLSRRQFLAGSAGAMAATLVGESRASARKADPDSIALLSDAHIAADAATVSHKVNMAEHLKSVCSEIVAAERRPALAIVTGDLALLDGQPGDYATFLELVKPIRTAGLPVTLGLGNHDDRERFWAAIDEKPDALRPVKDRHVAVIKHHRANLVLLDSLSATNHTPGVVGGAQLKWLSDLLDSGKGKPTVVLVHHNPDETPDTKALTDTKALLDVLIPRRQVKALIFGHTHDWNVSKRDDLHLINLPPVGYVFSEGRPSGWVNALLADDGMTLTLSSLDAKHPQHQEQHALKWRSV